MKYEDIGMVFNEYPTKFPVDQDVSIIYGDNGSGKTQVLRLLKKYYEEKGENVLYFNTERLFNLSEEEVDGVITIYKLAEDEKDVLKELGIELKPWDYENMKGKYIKGGFLHIINFLGTIMLADRPSIVLIDTIETSIHISLRRIILKIIKNQFNTKKLIVTTHCPEIFSSYKENTVQIHISNCLQLN